MSTKLALELIVLTARRPGEARFANGDEIDMDNLVWTMPADRMKAKKEHRVPLSPRALEVLKQARQLDDGSGLVFPATKVGRPLSDNTLSNLTR